MKWICYLAAVAAVLLLPSERMDIGKLKPVELIRMSMQDNQIVLKTDTGDIGKGETLELAVENMKKTTAGIIYLDTAEYLLLDRDMEENVESISNYLKDDVQLYQCRGEINLEDAAAYLDIHGSGKKLRNWKGSDLPMLVYEEDRYWLKNSWKKEE